jgi:lipopolysaccharide transport system ATP-binding protein
MNDVAEKEGRTVLFVSHNMVAVQALCNRALLLRKGNVEIDAGVEPVIQYYLSATPTELAVPLQERFDRKGNGLIRFASFAFENFEGSQSSQIRSGEDTIFVLGYTADRPISLDKVAVAIVVSSLSGQRLCTFYSEFTGNKFSGKSTFGEFKCFVPKLPLASGIYKVNLWSSIAGEILDWIQDAATFEIVDGDYFGTGRMPNVSVHGPFLINHWWEQTDQG